MKLDAEMIRKLALAGARTRLRELEAELNEIRGVVRQLTGASTPTEVKAAKMRAARKQEKEKLLEILAEKQAGKLSELSEKELQKRIAALDE